MGKNAELLPGTLDMLILKAVSLKPLHGYGVLLRIQQISGEALTAARLALPGALSPRTPGPDRGRMGRERQQAQGQVLHADRRGTAAACARKPRSGTSSRRRSQPRSAPHQTRCKSCGRAFARSPACCFVAIASNARCATRCAFTSRPAPRISSAKACHRAEAMRRARIEFGTVDAIKDDCRQSRGVRWFDETTQRSPVCAAVDGQDARLHRRGGAVAGARHRRQHRDLQPDGRGAAAHDSGRIPAGSVFHRHGKGERPGTSSNYRCSSATRRSTACSAASRPTHRRDVQVAHRRARERRPDSG